MCVVRIAFKNCHVCICNRTYLNGKFALIKANLVTQIIMNAHDGNKYINSRGPGLKKIFKNIMQLCVVYESFLMSKHGGVAVWIISGFHVLTFTSIVSQELWYCL